MPYIRYPLPMHLVTGYRIPVTGYLLPVTGYLLPVACCLLPVACCLLPVAGHLGSEETRHPPALGLCGEAGVYISGLIKKFD